MMSLRLATLALLLPLVMLHDARGESRQLSFALDEEESLRIGAQGDITWSGENHSLVARNSAFVEQGAQRVDADTIFFFFNDSDSAEESSLADLTLASMDAAGEVHIQNDTSRATAERAHYDAQRRMLTLYGESDEEVWLLLTQRQLELTAKKEFIYDDITGEAYAHGGTQLKHPQFTLTSEQLTIWGQAQRRVTALRAKDNVILNHARGQLHGDEGVYDMLANVITMSGDVRLMTEGRELAGDYGVFNLRSGLSRLISFSEARDFKARHKASIPKGQERPQNNDTRRPSAVIDFKRPRRNEEEEEER